MRKSDRTQRRSDTLLVWVWTLDLTVKPRTRCWRRSHVPSSESSGFNSPKENVSAHLVQNLTCTVMRSLCTGYLDGIRISSSQFCSLHTRTSTASPSTSAHSTCDRVRLPSHLRTWNVSCCNEVTRISFLFLFPPKSTCRPLTSSHWTCAADLEQETCSDPDR